MTHDIIYYFGLSFIFLSFILLYFLFYKINKIKNTLDLKGILKKYGLFGIGTAFSFLLGFILLDAAFFIDQATIDNAIKHNIEIDGGHLALTYLFTIFSTIFLFSSIYLFYILFYINNLTKSEIKKTKISFGISLTFLVISFISFTEGIAPYLVYPLANTIHIGEGGIILTRNGIHDKGLNIALYAIFILSGALLVLAICDHITYKNYGKHGLLYTCFFIAFPSGIIGARLWYVILDISNKGQASQFIQDWTKIFAFRDGGLGIMGGAILGIIAGVSTMLVLKYAIKRDPYTKMNYLFMVDYIVPTILIAQAIGRWGNFFNNEINGYEISTQYFAFLPTFIKNQMMFAEHGSQSLASGQMYLPLFFIEFLTNLAGYFVLYFGFGKGYFSKRIISFINLFKKDEKIIKVEKYHADGTLAGGYLMWYGATRAILEPLRTGADYFRSSVVSSYVMMGLGAAIILFFILFKELYTDRKKIETYEQEQ